MSASAQDLLDAINDVILKRLNGDGYVEYTATTQRFRGESIEALYRIRNQLQNEVNAANGNDFALAEPFFE